MAMRRISSGTGLILMGLLGAACTVAPGRTASPPAGPPPVSAARPAAVSLPASSLGPDQRILHALNRLGYGPRPGDLERVRQMGLAAYIERQLDPRAIPDPAVEQALVAYPVLTQSTVALVRDYPRPTPQLRQRLASGEMSRQEVMEAYPAERRPAVITAQMQAARITRAIGSDRQLEEVMVDFWFNHFNVYAQKGAVRWMLPAYEREAMGRTRSAASAIWCWRPRDTPRCSSTWTTGSARAPISWSRPGPTRAGAWGSTRTTPGSSWSCTPSAWTAATPSRT